MSYHVTNSSHVIDHFLRMLRSLRYMCCIACCWKLRLTPAVRVGRRGLRGGVLSPTGGTSGLSKYCNWQHMFLHTAKHLRIVSYRDILCDIVSYLSFFVMAVSCHHYTVIHTHMNSSHNLLVAYWFTLFYVFLHGFHNCCQFING